LGSILPRKPSRALPLFSRLPSLHSSTILAIYAIPTLTG
jgi:hypothetical protein